MLFQSVALYDIHLEDYDISQNGVMGLTTKKRKFVLPRGTVVDVYGISPGAGTSEYAVPLFIFAHESLPHFFTANVTSFKPLH